MSESKHTIYESRASTHADDCWSWGPGHYKCAVREIERLQRRVAELEHAARIHAETIKEMQRAHAEEIRAMREEIRDAVAEARWSQHEDGW